MSPKEESKRSKGLRSKPEAQLLYKNGWIAFRHARAWEPPTDVYECDKGLVVRVEIAGIERDDLSIALQEKLLVVEGVRKDPEHKQWYHRMEIPYGEFRTEVLLPWSVDVDAVEAVYEEGFLKITLPRPAARRVNVRRESD